MPGPARPFLLANGRKLDPDLNSVHTACVSLDAQQYPEGSGGNLSPPSFSPSQVTFYTDPMGSANSLPAETVRFPRISPAVHSQVPGGHRLAVSSGSGGAVD